MLTNPNAALEFLTIEAAARLLRRKKISPVELLDLLLDRLKHLNPELIAYLTVTADAAHRQACEAEKRLAKRRPLGPLDGIPICLKDNIATRGVRTTVGSKILAGWVPNEDAPIVARLASAGAILLGKTNMHEFAYGVTSENPHHGATKNPWDTSRIAGGSSGGSAAALAAGLAFASAGSDTGGSIRIPAACCGVVGLKPTFGRVSCRGVFPLAPSLDHAGPMARTVSDVALILDAIAGFDPLDPYSVEHRVSPYHRALDKKSARMRLGWPENFFFENVDAEILAAVEAARQVLEKRGAKFEPVSLPSLTEAAHAGAQISFAEARHCHESAGYFPARAAEYGEDVRQWLEQGASVTAVELLRAEDVRRRLRTQMDAALEHLDAILAPTLPVVAPPLGTRYVSPAEAEESIRAALLRLNRPANLTGHPAISLLCGFSRENLPIGLQLIARHWQEARLLQIALAFEQSAPYHTRHPV